MLQKQILPRYCQNEDSLCPIITLLLQTYVAVVVVHDDTPPFVPNWTIFEDVNDVGVGVGVVYLFVVVMVVMVMVVAPILYEQVVVVGVDDETAFSW